MTVREGARARLPIRSLIPSIPSARGYWRQRLLVRRNDRRRGLRHGLERRAALTHRLPKPLASCLLALRVMRITGDSGSGNGSTSYLFQGGKPRKLNKRQSAAECQTADSVELSSQSVRNPSPERQELVAREQDNNGPDIEPEAMI